MVLLCFIIFSLTFYVKNIGPLFGTDVRYPRTTLPELAYEWVYTVHGVVSLIPSVPAALSLSRVCALLLFDEFSGPE